MLLALTILAVALIAMLLLRTAARLAAARRQRGGLHRARLLAPHSTLLPRGSISRPRLIGRYHMTPRPVAGQRRRGWLALAPLALVAIGILFLLPLRQDAKHHTAELTTGTVGDAAGLPGVGMPEVLPGDVPVKPLQIAIVFDRTYAGGARERELRAIGAWLQARHSPWTRITVVDRTKRRASLRLAAAGLPRARLVARGPSLSHFVRHAFGRHRDRLLVTTGRFNNPSAADAATVRVRPRFGAGVTRDVRLARGAQRVVEVDPRRRNALAATVARAVIAVSGMRERR